MFRAAKLDFSSQLSCLHFYFFSLFTLSFLSSSSRGFVKVMSHALTITFHFLIFRTSLRYSRLHPSRKIVYLCSVMLKELP